MTDAFYTDLRDGTVDPLMTQFGFDMVLKSSREPTVDPNTGAITVAAAEVSTAVSGLFRFYSQDEINREDVLANDIQCLIGGTELNTAGIFPDSSMQLIANGTTYNVVRVTPTQPGGVSVLYRLQIRK
jgi:hypothetical protein